MPDFAFARLEKIEKAISADAGFSIDLLMHNEVAVSSILYVHFSVTKNRERIRAIAVWDEQGVEVKL